MIELLRLIEKNGYNHAAVARELGVSYMSIYRWTHGKGKPSPSMKKLISVCLEMEEQKEKETL